MLFDRVRHAVPVLAVDDQAAQLRAEAGRFTLPVAHQADWRNDERRPGQAPGVLFHLNVHQRLQGLAQPHVVGQDAGQPMGAQKLQPAQALQLVGA